MSLNTMKISIAAACAAGVMMLASPVLAQQSVMKECGAKWQAAKAAKQTGNQTWPKFLSKCRADSAKKSAKPDTKAKADSKAKTTKKAKSTEKADSKAKKTTRTTTRKSTSKVAGAPAGIVFPRTVSAKYKDLSPGLARNKTCADRYNANKKSGKGNAGLTYIPKVKGGQGYWPLCNTSLKQ